MAHPPRREPSTTSDVDRSVARPWQQRASPLARYGLVAYTLLVIDASLYPFSGWRDLGLPPFGYLHAPWPHRTLGFDVWVNVLGYLPLGIVTGLALYPRLTGFVLVAVSSLYCGALSAALEALQTFLPTRVASVVDLLTNLLGAIIGSLIAARMAGPVLDRGRLREWRLRWFGTHASRGLVLVALWFGALVYPEQFALGSGALLRFFDAALPEEIGRAFALEFDAAAFVDAESVVTALALCGAGLLFASLLRHELGAGTRLLLMLVFIATTAAMKILMTAVIQQDSALLAWLSIGARRGFFAGAVVLIFALVLPAWMRAALGFAAIAGAVALVNVLPENPYVVTLGAAWTRGRLLNFFGLAQGLNLVWPFLALAYFLRHSGTSLLHLRASRRRRARPPL